MPHIINITLNGGGNNGSKTLPKGVGKYNKTGRFMSRHKGVTLGLYDTVSEAFSAYKVTREEHIKNIANQYKDQIDPRAYNALMSWEVNIDD